MSGPTTAILVICIVAVAGLAIWLIAMPLAARKPRRERAPGGRRPRGSVQGGRHAAGGRGPAPRRDGPVTPLAATPPEGLPRLDEEGDTTARSLRARRAGR